MLLTLDRFYCDLYPRSILRFIKQKCNYCLTRVDLFWFERLYPFPYCYMACARCIPETQIYEIQVQSKPSLSPQTSSCVQLLPQNVGIPLQQQIYRFDTFLLSLECYSLEQPNDNDRNYSSIAIYYFCLRDKLGEIYGWLILAHLEAHIVYYMKWLTSL